MLCSVIILFIRQDVLPFSFFQMGTFFQKFIHYRDINSLPWPLKLLIPLDGNSLSIIVLERFMNDEFMHFTSISLHILAYVIGKIAIKMYVSHPLNKFPYRVCVTIKLFTINNNIKVKLLFTCWRLHVDFYQKRLFSPIYFASMYENVIFLNVYTSV